MTASAAVRIKRIYEDPSDDDGVRVLVDRLWPRGVSRERAGLDEWMKDAAPSPELRKWWDHDPDRMDEFARRYLAEISDHGNAPAADAVVTLRYLASRPGGLTLLYAATDPEINHAKVLRDHLVE
ncbi:DUF488 domain-containing protein [Demequina oxidasica]|uniref:DUF488 domain-containing protein n=1 Tax=Demequina oxidasica TaxID=676199 RepID=UPI0007835E00|nr:DUF488 family protein [Demequina oxidasica]